MKFAVKLKIDLNIIKIFYNIKFYQRRAERSEARCVAERGERSEPQMIYANEVSANFAPAGDIVFLFLYFTLHS